MGTLRHGRALYSGIGKGIPTGLRCLCWLLRARDCDENDNIERRCCNGVPISKAGICRGYGHRVGLGIPFWPARNFRACFRCVIQHPSRTLLTSKQDELLQNFHPLQYSWKPFRKTPRVDHLEILRMRDRSLSSSLPRKG